MNNSNTTTDSKLFLIFLKYIVNELDQIFIQKNKKLNSVIKDNKKIVIDHIIVESIEDKMNNELKGIF